MKTRNAACRPAVVVGVGASAGALDALRTLLGGVPAGLGATFVIIDCSPEGHESRLAELLQPYTALPVQLADGIAPLGPDTVLVLPPAVELAAIDSHLHVATAASGTHRARIDRVFRALAAARGSRAIGVLLTGAGSDGASGLAHIQHAGGLTMVQDPAEAEYPRMPSAAIEAGVADLVLSLRDMPAAIDRFCAADPRLPTRGGEPGGIDAEPLAELLALLETRTQRDFSVYRPAVLARRIGRRMRLRAVDDWSKYLELLDGDAAEAEALAAEVLANVATFFRPEETFARLEGDVLPRVFAAKANDRDAIRAWVVGCSMGETAYSLAIALLEERARRNAQTPIQVFASDVAEEALQRARLGTYSTEIEDSVSAERLAKYFVRDEHGYRVRSELRNIVVFASHDVVNDFPFSRLDLVVCRHRVLEDLVPKVQKAVLHNFHHSLRSHGLLVVDSSVGLDLEAQQLFAADDGGGVYRRLAARTSASAPPRRSMASPPHVGRTVPDTAGRPAVDARAVHLGMLERYAPASVLVDADHHVIHYSARAGRYLRIPGGELTHDVVRLLREPLRSAVRGGLEAVERRPAPWASDALLVHTYSGMRRVAVHVEPVSTESALANAKLVVFEELEARESLREDEIVPAAADFTSQLESDIDEASRRLRAVVAQGERVREMPESRAQGDDSELAHVLGDLDAAKKELRSVNEELLTLNRDNRVRLEELARLSADLEVLLESTGLATLFLDRDLKIVRFTPPLLEIFDVVPGDKGRPLEELRHRLRDSDLNADARRVLKHMTPIEREVEADTDRWYLLRMLPYRSAPQGLGGVAMTLVDITSRKKAELELREADRRKDEFIALLAHELRNPLAPISSGIEILQRSDLDPAIAARVTLTMSRQAAQLVRLIDDLLDVSRIRSGRLRLRKTHVALADIVRDAVAAVRPLIERSGHELTVETPAERVMLDADAARLTQVVANLLNNSARYTPSGGKIEVRARREGGVAVVTVKDNGYGIPSNALPHVFEMFYQGADSRAATQTGLGIGLALAKSLVDMHGGAISAASAGVDRGSEFALRLPVLEQEHVEPAAASVAEAPLGGHRVLVVDDNADAAKTLAVLIQTLGANDVHVAFSGEEALPLAERVKPDTVFLDLKMPDMDGYEIAQRLRSEPWCENTWLVALTGWGLDEHKRRTKDAGFDQHLTKPADRAALEAILRRPAGGATALQ